MLQWMFLILIAIFLLGCTNKEPLAPIQNDSLVTEVIQSDDNSSGELDEFEDEFSQKETEPKSDPLRSYNEVMTSFNDKVFTYALNPISESYAHLPTPLRQSVSNFIYNLKFPVRLANNVLQGKVRNSFDEMDRFIVNSTVGLGGLFDPATSYLKIPTHDEDFGQTLGHYGLSSGFHIVLPFLGPSNVRDVVGLVADGYISPLYSPDDLVKYKIPKNYLDSAAIKTGEIINKNSLNLGAYESLKKDAIELYPFLRDVYEQKRDADIEK